MLRKIKIIKINKWKKTNRQEILIVCQEKANIEIDKKKCYRQELLVVCQANASIEINKW